MLQWRMAGNGRGARGRNPVILPLLLSLLVQVTHCCTDNDVKYALANCDSILSAISTTILATMDKDYGNVCRVFNEYIICVETRTAGCTSLLMKRYRVNRKAYARMPYNCSIPTISEAMYKSNQRQATGGSSHAICHIQIILLAMSIMGIMTGLASYST